MNKKILIPIMMAFVLVTIGFFKLHPPQSTGAAESADKTVLKIQLKQTQNNTQTYQIEYDYKNNNPVIVLSSHQFKNIDIPFLVDQFDKENVGINEQNQQIFLNLKKFKQSNGSFQLRKLGEDPLLLNIRNAKNELLYQSKIDSDMKEPFQEATTSHAEIQPAETNVAYNNLEAPSTEVDNNQLDEDTTEESTNTDKNIIDDSAQPEITRDPDWDRGWSERAELLVARGIEKKLPTGRTSMPVQYFGALNYALTNTGVYDSVRGRPLRPGLILPGPSRGTGRKNNLTAANSAIITYRPGHHWNEAQVDDDDDYRLNYYLNYTFGDGLLYSDGWFNDAEDKAYRGSQRNFITTNLFDYYLPTGDISKPRIYGPDFEEKDVWGIDEHNVHYYIKNDKLYRDGNPNNTSSKNVVETIKQRLVFRQVMKNTIVQVTITMRFDNNNTSIITTEFKNIGTTYIDNFQGYTFRDITFLYNHKRKGSKQDNIIRSLGNHVGAYASRNDKFNSRIEFKLNGYPDSPYAWSARGTRSTFYQAYDGDHFPWNFKGLNNQYDDAFTDIYDRGDRDREPSFGKPFMDFATDSGISMHTKNQPLLPNQQVAMTYSTNIIQKDEVPLLDLTNAEENSKENPKVIPYLSNNAEITGTWLYDRMHDVNVKYVIEDADIKHKDENEFAKHIMQNGVSVTKGFQNQSLADMHNRVKHPWTAKIPFNELGTGLRKVTFVAYDKENKCSKLKTYYILIPEQTEVKNFEIQVMTPESSTEPGFPYDPRKNQQHVDKLTITG
ncbi:hypothetical protein [Companilactobacillus zhongbaensis]|uniref:hypothetical protein n=1 Tax=Companilactobacillus zhongbaensis TaxID=2486009 RepID=UPI000F79E00C|nr:hypothetical protein [Companilactobacillus zhongbaensis]